MSRYTASFDLLIAPRVNSAPDVVSNDFQNVTGRVITLGDIHGAAAFSNALSSLNKDDRLVLVGDLMDRGANTFPILNAIVKWPIKDQIVSVRGNHEEMFLRYMEVRRKAEQQLFINLENQNHYKNFINNGGDWANKKSLQELEPIASYVDQLPYIRQVSLPQNQQFLVCHADMSMLSDQNVQKLLSGQKQLSVEEKATLVWARGDPQAEIPYHTYQPVRNTASLPVYVGHEITTRQGVSVVRDKTNHINLDFGAYDNGPLVGVVHPNKAVVFGDFINPHTDTKPFFNQLMQLHQKMGAIEFHSIPILNMYKQHLLHSNKNDLIATCQLNLSNQYLSKQNFSNEDLSGANLSGANLSGANLSGANLSGANLSGADLSGADISGVDFTRVTVNEKTLFKNVILTQSQTDSLSNKQQVSEMIEKIAASNINNETITTQDDFILVTKSVNTAKDFISVVSDALKSYQKQHNPGFSSIFHSQGAEYVARALYNLNQATDDQAKLEIAKQICNDILCVGVKRDAQGNTTIKAVDSRMHCLLNALENKGLITSDWRTNKAIALADLPVAPPSSGPTPRGPTR